MVVCLRRASEHQAIRQAGGNRKNGFQKDSLSGKR